MQKFSIYQQVFWLIFLFEWLKPSKAYTFCNVTFSCLDHVVWNGLYSVLQQQIEAFVWLPAFKLLKHGGSALTYCRIPCKKGFLLPICTISTKHVLHISPFSAWEDFHKHWIPQNIERVQQSRISSSNYRINKTFFNVIWLKPLHASISAVFQNIYLALVTHRNAFSLAQYLLVLRVNTGRYHCLLW